MSYVLFVFPCFLGFSLSHFSVGEKTLPPGIVPLLAHASSSNTIPTTPVASCLSSRSSVSHCSLLFCGVTLLVALLCQMLFFFKSKIKVIMFKGKSWSSSLFSRSSFFSIRSGSPARINPWKLQVSWIYMHEGSYKFKTGKACGGGWRWLGGGHL